MSVNSISEWSIDGKMWGMDDNRHSLLHIVEAERHWWACTNWKTPSREEDLRHKKLLNAEEYKAAHDKFIRIWWWLNDVRGLENELINDIVSCSKEGPK